MEIARVITLYDSMADPPPWSEVVHACRSRSVEEALALLEAFSLTTVKNRVRQGGSVVQKRKKVSARRGFTYDSKTRRVMRIAILAHLHRSRAAKLSKSKRMSKRTMAKIKRARSMRMRKMLGFDRRR